MLKTNIALFNTILACSVPLEANIVLPETSYTNINVSSEEQSINKETQETSKITSLTTSQAVSITAFGAHSITEKGYEHFDSSNAINKAIQYAAQNNIPNVDFGSGKYYAKNISLESNITYSSVEGAELIASSDIKLWHSVLGASNKNNITIKGLTINGNKDIVYGNSSEGSYLVFFSYCNNITVDNCYLYNNKYLAISLQNNCNYITIKHNIIYDTDCGISTQHSPCNNLLIDGNTISGSSENQTSEPISIYNNNDSGFAHDIVITNNTVHDKSNASGILVVNATNILVKGNTVYNCCNGINVGIDGYMTGSRLSIPYNITISENNVYNCEYGIRGELNNSLISKNTLTNLDHIGIGLFTQNSSSNIANNTIINNTITNINSIDQREPAIVLTNTSNCIIDKNSIFDTRAKTLNFMSIQVSGTDSDSNIIQNNTNLGPAKSGYQIYVQSSKNTTVQNNVATILDEGIQTKLLNNITR